MLGGNASSEVRMWICGANGKNVKESGILEEIQLENLRYNPSLNYSVWDHILIQFVQRQENLTLLLNCTCDGVEMDGNRIKMIHAWQMTSQKHFEITAKLFSDCSGDSVLRVSGAEWRSSLNLAELLQALMPRLRTGLGEAAAAVNGPGACRYERLRAALPELEDALYKAWFHVFYDAGFLLEKEAFHLGGITEPTIIV